MHGCSLGSALLVNAEVDSMGGVVDGGAGIATKTSPRRAAIEKAQVELRQEYDVREERRRELEFLEKGGNPLDFKFGNAASVSVQSTSLTDHPPEQFVTSEAKGSFALTASPHGDSVESSGRPRGPTICEPNCADNLLLFDGENEFLQGEKNTVHPTRSNIAPSEQSSQLDGSQNAKESGDSTAFGLPEKAYKRRNRSRPNRDGARSSSNDMVLPRGGHVLSLPLRHGLNDVKGSVLSTNNHKDNTVSLNYNSKPTSPNGSMALKALPSDGRLDMALDNVQAVESTTGLAKVGLSEPLSDFNASKSLQDNQQNQQSQVDGQKVPAVGVGVPQSVDGREHVVSAGLECLPCMATKTENETSSGQRNGFSDAKGDKKSIPNEGQISSAAFSTKGLDSESSCTQTSVSLDGNIDSGLCNNLRNVDSNGNTKEKTSVFVGPSNMEDDDLKEKNDKKVDGICAFINDENSVHQIHQNNGPVLRAEDELHRNGSSSQNEVKCPPGIEGMEANCNTASEAEKNHGILMADNSNPQKENDCSGRLRGSIDSNAHDNSNPQRENSCGRLQGSMDLSNTGLLEPRLSHRGSNDAPEKQTCPETQLQLATKAHEDSILEEARIIEAKRKRIAELSVGTLPSENHQRSHWDFVLEEMTWLANDFAQERLWKTTAAAQLCHRIASTSRLRFEEQNLRWKQQKVAHSLAKAIMGFWRSAEETSKEVQLPIPETDSTRAVRGYAVRFLKYNASLVPLGLAEAPMTPDRISDLGIQEMSWEDHFTEENLFYTVPPGAMETYRKSIESHLAQVEKTGSSIREEVETSTYDAAADFGSLDNAYEEDEGETSYYLPGGFEGSRPLRFAQNRRKDSTKSYAESSYDPGTDFMQCMENKVGNQPSVLVGKRPANSLNVGSIPTKRMRTASRQRVVGPFSAVPTGGVQGPIKTDASSGDTNSYQDDQSTLHGGSQIPNSLEVESLGDFERQLPFDSTEVSKPKKKKKAKHLSSTYEQRWQLDNNFQNEQRDYSKKRLDGHHFESNGSSGLFGQPTMKKPKMMRQSHSFDNIAPMTGSIPSPVASQMSNMSNPNKLIKILGGRDRGRKAKSLKIPAGQPGSGSAWSLFEDQALVVLVHDMGPNWELVSDAINGTLQFKCIFRKPKECKERHKILMDRTAGDGADSAEDSGSSQPYPSTLPGIPKGSARQLFQRLQGPMEEDLIKSHFEKIITISQKQHYRRGQNDNQDSKPILPHNSHTFALSQVSPNNLNGGPRLTPLDLCDTTAPSPDILAPQVSHASGLAISNQGTVIPASGTHSSMQGSSNMVLGSNFSSPSGPLGALVRDGRYGVPRSASLSIDEQQRMQQYSQMFSGRNIQQSSLSVSGAPPGADRGVRMLSGGNGMGIMCGINRSMPMARPGFQGIPPSPVLNSGSMLSSSMGAMPNPVMHSGVGSGQGNSMLRPRDALNMMRPGQNPEHQKQMMVAELQMQVTQGNSQGVPPFGGLNSAFSNQTSPPVQTYPLHQQQHQLSPQQSHALNNPHHPHLQGPNHASGTQQQAYAIRVAKERQLQQQRLLQQQHHQQFAASNALMPHVQSQPQLPMSSSLQNCSPVQPQAASAPVSLPPTQSSSMTPMSHHQQKLHMPPHGLNRNAQTGGSGMTNQMGKQRQRQPPQQQSFLQAGRHHPQQRQHSQSQQQAKLIKGVGRGNVLMQHNLMTDPSLLNGPSTTPGGQSAEKAEQVMHLMQGQGLYSGPGLNPVQPSKPLMPHCSNQPLPPQKMYSGQPVSSSKQVQQMPSHSDSNSNHGHAALPAASGHTLPASHQAVPPSVMSSANHQQLQPHQKLVNQTQPAVQRVFQQNCQLNSDQPSKGQAEKAQADQKPMNNTSPMGTAMVMPQPPIDTAVSPASAQWKAPDQIYDSGLPNPSMQLAPVGSPSLTNSSGSEPMPTVSLGQGQSSSSLPSLGHNIGAHWQQQSQLQPPSTPPPQPSQQQQQQQSPQQQSQHLQAGNNSLYIRTANSRLE